MKRQLLFTSAALADLDDIFWFVAADNPHRARRYVREIEDACRTLRDMPNMGRPRPDLRPGLRILSLWKRIVVAYELEDDRIEVLRIFSAGRDYEMIMSGDA